MSDRRPSGGLSPAFISAGTSSFVDFAAAVAPEVLPSNRTAGEGAGAMSPHGTTIVAATFPGGVVVAGDRRATMGNMIAQRDIEKVFAADEFSIIGIAGAAGIAVEMVGLFQLELEHYEKIEGSLLSLDGKANRLATMIRGNLGLAMQGLAVELVRLFRLELEHYEKIEGIRLSLDGKANRLATMIRGNLGMAMQGLAVVPLFAGIESDQVPDPAFDVARRDPRRGRIFSYDVAGGKYEEHDYYAVGSGSTFARSALKKRYDSAADVPTAVRAAVEALYDAADDDSATGGPDLTRRIFPVVVAITVDGAVRWSDDEVGVVAEAVVAGRMVNPGG